MRIRRFVYYAFLFSIPLGLLLIALGVVGAWGPLLMFLGFLFVFCYYIKKSNDSYPGVLPVSIIGYMLLLSVTSLVLFAKYFGLAFGDYPGLVVLPLLFLATVCLVATRPLQYKRLSITGMLFVLLSMPVIHITKGVSTQGYLPQMRYNSNTRSMEALMPGDMPWVFANREAELLTAEAIELYRKGFNRPALAKLQKADGLEPDNVRVLFEISAVYGGAGQYREAIGYLERASSLDPCNIYYLNNIGLYHYMLGEHRKSVEALNKALEINSADTNTNCTILAYAELADYERFCYHIGMCVKSGFNIGEGKFKKMVSKHCNR